MILSDEIFVAIDIGDEVNVRGWRVTGVFSTLNAALKAIETEVPVLAIPDINLRGKRSFDLARDLRARGTVIVFLSGNTVHDLPEDLQDCAFPDKLVNYDRLQDTLLKAIGADA